MIHSQTCLFLDRIITDDYVHISAAVGTLNKQQYLNTVRKGDVKFDSIDVRDQQVRVYGDTAVSTATINEKGRSKTKGDISGTYQTTRVWVKWDGGWKTVSFESTPLTARQSSAR